MPYDISADQIRMRVMRGELSPDELPSIKAAKAARDKEYSEWKKSGHREEVYRDGRAVPHHVLDAEKIDGEQRVFVRREDWSGWVKPAPATKPEEVLMMEKRSGQQWAWDYSRSHWRPWLDFNRPCPPGMKEQADRFFPDPSDVRRPRHNTETNQWEWPQVDAGRNKGYGDIVFRDDLKSPSGYSMEYWKFPNSHMGIESDFDEAAPGAGEPTQGEGPKGGGA